MAIPEGNGSGNRSPEETMASALYARKAKLIAEEFMSDSVPEGVGHELVDADELIRNGMEDLPLLGANFNFVPFFDGVAYPSPHHLARYARRYVLGSLYLQNEEVVSGYRDHPEEIFGNLKTRMREKMIETVQTSRDNLLRAAQDGVVGRIDRALFVRRELDNQKRLNPQQH